MCGWSESNQWYLSDLSFRIIYSKCSLPDTVIYRGCFKHYSERVEGPQLDQEEITTDRFECLGLRTDGGLGGLPQYTHLPCYLSKRWRQWMSPLLTRWGRKRVLFPEGLFSFPRDSVLPIEKSKGRFIFQLCFRNRAQTCSLLEDVKLFSIRDSASVKTGLSVEGAVFPALSRWWELRSELHTLQCEAQGAIDGFELCFSWESKCQKSPQNFQNPKS